MTEQNNLATLARVRSTSFTLPRATALALLQMKV
jgi:hypothetical protein